MKNGYMEIAKALEINQTLININFASKKYIILCLILFLHCMCKLRVHDKIKSIRCIC